MGKCGKILYSRTGHRWKYGTCALLAGYVVLQTHTQESKKRRILCEDIQNWLNLGKRMSDSFHNLISSRSSPRNVKILIRKLQSCLYFNLLKPTGQKIHHQFNIQKFYMVLASRWVFCVDIWTDSDFCFIHHWLTGFYNRGGKCLLRGTNWVFK